MVSRYRGRRARIDHRFDNLQSQRANERPLALADGPVPLARRDPPPGCLLRPERTAGQGHRGGQRWPVCPPRQGSLAWMKSRSLRHQLPLLFHTGRDAGFAKRDDAAAGEREPARLSLGETLHVRHVHARDRCFLLRP